LENAKITPPDGLSFGKIGFIEGIKRIEIEIEKLIGESPIGIIFAVYFPNLLYPK
jgi:hypothetical protein